MPPTAKCPPWDASEQFGKALPQLTAVYSEAITLAKSKMTELDDVKQWHGKVFEGHPPTGFEYYAGNFRQVDLARPCLQYEVRVGTNHGTASKEVFGEMESLFADARSLASIVDLKWGTLNPIERATHLSVIIGELVGRFIQIHPFRDGNGRMSRILWAVALTRYGVSPLCRIHPRPDMATPYGPLMASCMQGDFKPLQLVILKHLIAERPSLV